MRQEPYVYVPGNSDGESRCDHCLVSGSGSGNLSKCSGCQVAWYCGGSCQIGIHTGLNVKPLTGINKAKRKSVTPSLRLMLKLYIRRRLQLEKIIPATVSDNHRLVEALVAHMSELEEKQLVLYAQMATLIHLILQWPEIGIREITENFSKLSCSAHTICDGELRPLGMGLYPVIAIINHSCAPNSVLVFDERTAVVRAVQHVAKVFEVFISYTETVASTATRRKALKEQFFFIVHAYAVPNWEHLRTSKRVLFWKVTDIGMLDALVSCSVIQKVKDSCAKSVDWRGAKKRYELSSVRLGLVLSKNLVIGNESLIERASKLCKQKSQMVEITQPTINAATLEGIPNNVDHFKEIMLPLTSAVRSFQRLRRWEDPTFLGLAYTLIFRNLLSYIFPATLIVVAVSMLTLNGLKQQGRLGWFFGRVTIRNQPPSNTIQKIMAVKDAMQDMESYLQNLNVVLLIKRSIMLSGHPQVITEVAFVLLASVTVLLLVPFKCTLSILLFNVFTREMVHRFTAFLKERLEMVSAAPVVVLPHQSGSSGRLKEAKSENRADPH